MRLRRLLEFSLVLVALGIVAWLIQSRFEAIAREARRVEVRMAADTIRTNAVLLQLRCPVDQSGSCLPDALRSLRRAGVGGVMPVEALPVPEIADAYQARLLMLVWASGAGAGTHPSERWETVWQSDGALRVGLKHVQDCQFVLRLDLKSGSVSVENMALVC